MLSRTRRKYADVYYIVTEGKVIGGDGQASDGLFAIRASVIDFMSHRGLGTKFVQFYNLVMPQLVNAEYVFKGLRRPLHNDEVQSGEAEEEGKSKLIHIWRPPKDFFWERKDGSTGTGECRSIDARPGFVFAVIASPNPRERPEYNEVDCFIEAWNWLEEDPAYPGLPVESVDRYDTRLWKKRSE